MLSVAIYQSRLDNKLDQHNDVAIEPKLSVKNLCHTLGPQRSNKVSNGRLITTSVSLWSLFLGTVRPQKSFETELHFQFIISGKIHRYCVLWNKKMRHKLKCPVPLPRFLATVSLAHFTLKLYCVDEQRIDTSTSNIDF